MGFIQQIVFEKAIPICRHYDIITQDSKVFMTSPSRPICNSKKLTSESLQGYSHLVQWSIRHGNLKKSNYDTSVFQSFAGRPTLKTL